MITRDDGPDDDGLVVQEHHLPDAEPLGLTDDETSRLIKMVRARIAMNKAHHVATDHLEIIENKLTAWRLRL